MRALFPLRSTIGFCVLFIFINSVSAQSLNQVVERHIAAMGGKEKLDSLKSIIMEGTFRIEGFELPLKGYIKNNEAQRYNVLLMKTPGFIILKEHSGWQYFPFQGMKEPLPLKEDELNTYVPYMDIRGVLYDFKGEESRFILLGTETIDEIPCYKISATLKSGKEILNYLDTSTYYIIKTSTKFKHNGKEQIWENHFANYQKTDDGFIFPFALTLGPGRAFVNKIIVNPVIRQEVFDPVAAKTSGF